MIKRSYFMSAKCTDTNGYCFVSQTATYSSIFANHESVFDSFTNELKEKLLQVRPNGNFEVVSFNRV